MEKQLRLPFISALASLSLSLLCLLLIAIWQPMSADDYDIQYSYLKAPSLIEHTLHWYHSWSGRAVGYTIGALALSSELSRTLFQCASALFFVSLAYLTACLALRKFLYPSPFNFFIFSFGLSMLWFCLPILGQTVFWTAGALVYLWPLSLLLALVAYIILPCVDGDQDRTTGFIAPFLSLVSGFLIGNFQEQASLALFTFFVVILMNPRVRTLVSIRYKVLPAACGFIFGASLLFLADGNHMRHAGVESLSMAGTLFRSIRFLSKVLGQDTLLFIFFIVFMRASLKTSSKNEKKIPLPFLWIILCLVSALPIILNPQFEQPRTAFYSSFFLLLFLLSTLFERKDPLSSLITSVPWLPLVATLPLLFSTSETAAHAYKLFSGEQERNSQVKAWKETKTGDIAFSPRPSINSYKVFVWDLTPDPTSMYNKMYAELKGIPAVKVDPVRE